MVDDVFDFSEDARLHLLRRELDFAESKTRAPASFDAARPPGILKRLMEPRAATKVRRNARSMEKNLNRLLFPKPETLEEKQAFARNRSVDENKAEIETVPVVSVSVDDVSGGAHVERPLMHQLWVRRFDRYMGRDAPDLAISGQTVGTADLHRGLEVPEFDSETHVQKIWRLTDERDRSWCRWTRAGRLELALSVAMYERLIEDLADSVVFGPEHRHAKTLLYLSLPVKQRRTSAHVLLPSIDVLSVKVGAETLAEADLTVYRYADRRGDVPC
ncbi:MAG: hypothetical protein ACU0GG_19645 [Paracoccaceae bacterium]